MVRNSQEVQLWKLPNFPSALSLVQPSIAAETHVTYRSQPVVCQCQKAQPRQAGQLPQPLQPVALQVQAFDACQAGHSCRADAADALAIAVRLAQPWPACLCAAFCGYGVGVALFQKLRGQLLIWQGIGFFLWADTTALSCRVAFVSAHTPLPAWEMASASNFGDSSWFCRPSACACRQPAELTAAR